MTEQKIMIRGGKDLGDCVQVGGVWYIRRDSFWVDGADMEDGWDVQIETGYHSHVELPATPEEEAFIQAYVARKEQEEKDRIQEMHDKYDAINARLARERAEKDAVKKQELRKKMFRVFPLGTRVRNRFITTKVGIVIAHHEIEAKLSIQWDGEDHPAYISSQVSIVQWFDVHSQDPLAKEK